MESSRVEYMAQKQNKIAQHLLNNKIGQIDKEFTLAKLGHRMFIKQLKYDMSQFRKSTGHSPLAQPPTGEEDTRNTKKINLSLPKLGKDSRIFRSAKDQPISSVKSADQVTQSADGFFLTQQDERETNETGAAINKGGEISETSRPIKPAQTTSADREFKGKRSSIDSLMRIKEANRVIKLPSVFKTSTSKSKQNLQALTRFLPPIAVASKTQSTNENVSEMVSTKEPVDETSDALNEELLSQEHAHHVRVSFTPRAKEKTTNIDESVRKPRINKILQMSLKRASEQRKADERKEQRQKMKAKLAIEEPFGLYRPDNMKLIHKIFKQEDLHNQHKVLLEENISKSTMPLPSKLGTSKLEGKLEAFLKNS